MVTDCVPVGRIRAGEEVYKIQAVSFYSLSTSRYDDWSEENEDSSEDTTSNDEDWEHPCAHLQKLFSTGSFYFTPDFDLTRTLQSRLDLRRC